MNKILIIICTGLILFSISCKEEIVTKEQVLGIVDHLETKMEWLDYKLSLEQWDLYTTGTADSLDYYQGLYRYLVSNDSITRILSRGKNLINDEDELRRWQLVFSAVKIARIEYAADIAELRDSLSTLDITYQYSFEGDPAQRSDLYRIYRTDKNPTRREAAYRSYNSVGQEMFEGLSQLFKNRNQAAKSRGYNSYINYIFDINNIKIDDYTLLLKALYEKSREPYRSVLGKVKEKTNNPNPEVWDVGFAYSDINKSVDRYFPVDSQMLFVKRSLEDIGFDIDKLPIYFDLESRPGKTQFAYQFPIKTPTDLRVLGNLTDGLQSTRILMHEIGHALHSAFVKQENPLYRNMLDGVWAESMGQILASLTYDKDWLMTYAHLPANLADSYIKAKKEQDLIYLRQQILWLTFELRAYENPLRDLNKLYWELSNEILMQPVHEDIYPWAAVIHFTTHPVYLKNYLYADIITSQTVAYLKENYQTISGNPSTKSFLVQNYYRFGAKYDWPILLKRGIDEDLDPEYFVSQIIQ